MGGDAKAIAKYHRLKSLKIKYFRVGIDDGDFEGTDARPETAASRASAASARESEYSSRPETALADDLFDGGGGGGGGGKPLSFRPGTGGRPGSTGGSRPGTGGGGRPGTGGGGRPPTGSSDHSRPTTGGHRPETQGIAGIADGDGDASRPPVPGRLTEQQLQGLESAEPKVRDVRAQEARSMVNAFEAVYEWLSRENTGRKVRCLVHSKTGFAAAPAVVAAYLIRAQGLSCEEALIHVRTKHSAERVKLTGTVWEEALRVYSKKYSTGHLICDDCFLETFVEGMADERILNEAVEKVVERLEANDRSLARLDLRDEVLGTAEVLGAAGERDGRSEQEGEAAEGGDGDGTSEKESGIELLCLALRDSLWLTQLDLSGNLISDGDCKLIGSALLTNGGLNVLNLSYNKIGDGGCEEIAAALKVHGLGVLNLSYNQVKEKGGAALGEMLRTNSRLFDLNLSNNALGDAGGYDLFDALTTPLYESEEVMLAKAKIYESGGDLGDVEESFNATLCKLDVSCNGLAQESAKRLVGVLQVNTVLAVLKLDYNPELGNTEAREIAGAMRTFQPSIEVLSINENNVGNDVAGAFARSLGDPNTLVRKFGMAQNCLRSTGASRVATALKGNSMLVFLDLGRNPIGSKGCAHIAEALAQNRTLTELVLDCCGISAEGCRALGEMLEKNEVLASLDLSDNAVLAPGAKALFGKLANNCGLRVLNMTNTGMGVKASEVIAECMKHNEVIESLNLSNNQLRNHGCKQLASMLGENVCLQKLDLSFNMISAIGVNEIIECVKKRDAFKYEPGKMKALELDVVLVGNLFSRDAEAVDDSQLMVLPRLARSKVVFSNATTDSRDVPMWQQEKNRGSSPQRNFVRRKSFTEAAGEDFDDDGRDVGKKFALSGTMIKSSSVDVLGGGGFGGESKQLGIVTTIAEPVEVPRHREMMEESGNDARRFTREKGAWNQGFSAETAFK